MKSTRFSFKPLKKNSDELAQLKRWKYASTKAKLNWLESAFVFGKLKRFKKT